MLLQLDSVTYIDPDEIVFIQHIVNRDELIVGLRGGFSVNLPYARRNMGLIKPFLNFTNIEVEVNNAK